MHLLNTYALSCGAKVGKPFIYETYIPLPTTNYITFQAQSKFESKDYEYWQDVINIISPILATKNIQIVQVGGENEVPYKRVLNLLGKTSVQQLAYVIKNAKLHVGPDSFGVHLASHYNIPLVGLYSATKIEIAGPYFGDKEKQILFPCYERVGNKKPSFSERENPKSINTILPEEIAEAIFKLLGIDFKIPFQTLHLGQRYGYKTIREIIPNEEMVLPNTDQPIEVRGDLCTEEIYLQQILSVYSKSVLVLDKPVDIQLLAHYKPNIILVVYKITQNDDPSFIEKVIKLGMNILLTSELDEETIKKKSLDYYLWGKINSISKINKELVDKLLPDINTLYYRSSKLIASKGKIFGSYADEEAEKTMQNDYEYLKVIDSPIFWKDLDFYTIVKKI